MNDNGVWRNKADNRRGRIGKYRLDTQRGRIGEWLHVRRIRIINARRGWITLITKELVRHKQMEMTSIKEETESTSVKLGSQPSSLSRSSSSSSPATSDIANSGSGKVPAISNFARTSILASNLARQTKLKALSASIAQASAVSFDSLLLTCS